MKYVPHGLIDNMAALIQIMTRRQAIIWINDGVVYVSLGLNDSTFSIFMHHQICWGTNDNKKIKNKWRKNFSEIPSRPREMSQGPGGDL